VCIEWTRLNCVRPRHDEYIDAWSECAHVTNDCRYPGIAIEAMEMVLKLANIEYELALVTVAGFAIIEVLKCPWTRGWGAAPETGPRHRGTVAI
jgi:hypothetical protein